MIFLLLALIDAVFLVAADNIFLNPQMMGPSEDYSQNDVWSLGSTQLVQWTTSFPSYNIIMWQQNLSVAAAVPGTSIFGMFTITIWHDHQVKAVNECLSKINI